ncbi:MAG TPA: helix-turn-helix transcriptional regulator [Thermoanaerobaculia bacterium]
MARSVPSPLSIALSHLRTARGWTQGDLASAAGLRPKRVSDLENGCRGRLDREQLDALATAMGYVPEEVDLALLLLAALGPPPPAARLSPFDPTPEEARRAARAAARLALTAASLLRPRLLGLVRERRERQARRRAEELWALLGQAALDRQAALIESSPRLHRWELAERLCAESARAASHDARLALHLARLALRVAELAPAAAAWRSRLCGYCWAFIANAQRVGNDFAAATASFAAAWRLWRAGAAAAAGPLGEWRLLDLEASLHRDRQQYAAALANLDRAFAEAPAAARGRILLKRATVLEQAGEVAAAVAVLLDATPVLETGGEPRDRWLLEINLLVNLCHLGRHREAQVRLPALRELTRALRNRLDGLRVDWLAGRVAAGLGRPDEARTAFKVARRGFTAEANGYDAALVALEQAVLDLEEGRSAEVRTLAAELAWIFQARDVHREALASLALFCRAAEREEATTDLARRVLAYLERARRDPGLRFEAPA